MGLVTILPVYHIPLTFPNVLPTIHYIAVVYIVFTIKYSLFAVCCVLCTSHESLFATLYYLLCIYHVLQPCDIQLSLFKNCCSLCPLHYSLSLFEYSRFTIHYWSSTSYNSRLSIPFLVFTFCDLLFTVYHVLFMMSSLSI